MTFAMLARLSLMYDKAQTTAANVFEQTAITVLRGWSQHVSMNATQMRSRIPMRTRRNTAQSAQTRRIKIMLTLQSDLHGNHLLGALPAHEWQAIAPHLELVQLRTEQLLCDSGQRIHHVYFPTTAIISLLHTMEDGGSVEIAAVGREGMTGVPVLTGGDTMPTRVQVQCAGFAYRMSASALREQFGRSDFLRRLMLLYMQALLTQVAQTAACNRHHSLSKQLCRWLLIETDRTSSDQIARDAADDRRHAGRASRRRDRSGRQAA